MMLFPDRSLLLRVLILVQRDWTLVVGPSTGIACLLPCSWNIRLRCCPRLINLRETAFFERESEDCEFLAYYHKSSRVNCCSKVLRYHDLRILRRPASSPACLPRSRRSSKCFCPWGSNQVQAWFAGLLKIRICKASSESSAVDDASGMGAFMASDGAYYEHSQTSTEGWQALARQGPSTDER